MTCRTALLSALLLATPTFGAAAQGVTVDEGRFRVTIGGRDVGTEEFVIRRAGFGRDNTLFATATIVLTRDGRRQEVRPLLSALPPEGTAEAYQLQVTGPQPMDVRLNRAGRRYVARISSSIGDEDREFAARPETRVVEQDVAHHYYFLRDLRPGRAAPVLELRGRGQLVLVAGEPVEEEIRVARNFVQARRVEFSDGEDRRTVWYDRQGRVVRVEIPGRAYVAVRTDLVG